MPLYIFCTGIPYKNSNFAFAITIETNLIESVQNIPKTSMKRKMPLLFNKASLL